MTEPDGEEPPSWRGQVVDWKANHFTISDAQADVPRLLRRLAKSIEELEGVEILDMTFCNQTEGRSFESKMTVYFSFTNDE